MKSELEKFRTRWRRWLGNKTRIDKPTWVTLLDANWLAWDDKTLSECDPAYSYHGITFLSTPEEVKNVFARAIDKATMDHLRKLDDLYCTVEFKQRFQ